MKRLMVVIFVIILCLINIVCDSGEEIVTGKRNDNAIKLNISLDGSLQNPAFSKDGRSIVFTRFRKGYNSPPSDLYIFNLETEELKQLVADGSSNVNLPGECWNDSMRSIVFSSDRDPHDEIYMINADRSSGDEERITNRISKMAFEPSFSPDGNWIVFESHQVDDEKNGVIIKYKTDGSSDFVNLTSEIDDCRQPNWSPSGNLILFQKYEGGKWDIWTVDSEGINTNIITNFTGNKTDGVFSGDGLFVVFSYENSDLENANIYKVAISGGNPIRLTDFSGYDGAPSISRDGSRLVFESCNGDPEESSGTTIWMLKL